MVIWKRKVYRLVIGSIFPVVYLTTGSVFGPLFLASFFLTLVLSLEYERWAHPQVWHYLLERFSVFKKTQGWLTGDTYFMVACFFLLLFFPKEIAVASLFFLTCGDAVSAIVGTRWGSHPIFPGKSLEGFLGCLAGNSLVAVILFFFLPLAGSTLAGGAVVASICESLPLKIDDNLSVGFASALVMKLLALAG